MCIGFPGKVISIDVHNCAVVDIGGTRREVSLDIIGEPVAPGDYVISHVGFAIHKVDDEQARESLQLLAELIENEIY